MKIGGGNYEEEDVAEAKRVTRDIIFQKINEGNVMNEGRMVVEARDKSLIPIAETKNPARKIYEQPPEEIKEEATPETSSETCSATSHKWSEPTTAPVTIQRTSVICKQCDLVLTTEKQGTAGEVMADLLRQIPH